MKKNSNLNVVLKCYRELVNLRDASDVPSAIQTLLCSACDNLKYIILEGCLSKGVYFTIYRD